MRREKRKINKFKVGIFIVILVLFLLTITGFARFVYINFRDRYLTSKKFYFTSDLLDMNGKTYLYENWDGNGIYSFDIDLYSKINDLQVLEDDLEYELMVTFPYNVNCAINSTEFIYPYEDEVNDEFATNEDSSSSGPQLSEEYKKPRTITGTILAENSNTDTATIYLKAIDDETVLQKGQEIKIEVSAYTTHPYRKKISATFNIKIATTSYYIEDEHNRDYALLCIRNSTSVDQEVTVEFLKEFSLYFDMNDDAFVNASSKDYTTTEQTIPNVGYEDFRYGQIKEITFEVPKESLKQIKLYKRYADALITINNGYIKVRREGEVEEEEETGNIIVNETGNST